jgi:SAM-dependent methyltransferase
VKSLLFVFLPAILLITIPAFSQTSKRNAQIQKLDFCGARYQNLKKIEDRFLSQFSFLGVNENDTIVDIGAQSGGFEGTFTALTNYQNLHFVLVDIDSACLNSRKLAAMNQHFAKHNPDYKPHSFSIVINTPDSLWLPKESYSKVWIINTLHEIPDQIHFLMQVNDVLRTGGEVVIQEVVPNRPGQKHGGCNKPLIPLDKLIQLFNGVGLKYKEKLNIDHGKLKLHLVRFIKTENPH